MRSQLQFVMHPDDEREFIASVLVEDDVLLIDGPLWKSERPKTFRSMDPIKGSYCMIWSPQDRPSLSARYIPANGDWYCDSEVATIQFLRSTLKNEALTVGRLAMGTSGLAQSEAAGIVRRYRAMSRTLRKRYVNSILRWCNPTLPMLPSAPQRSANPSKPDNQVWVGPHAHRWLQENPAHHVKPIAGFGGGREARSGECRIARHLGLLASRGEPSSLDGSDIPREDGRPAGAVCSRRIRWRAQSADRDANHRAEPCRLGRAAGRLCL